MIGNINNSGIKYGSWILNGIVTEYIYYYINLNSMIGVDNVNLEGILNSDSLNGNWNWLMAIGITHSGTFIDVR